MERVRLEEHNGHKIVCADCRNCGPDEIVDLCDAVRELVTAQPKHSVCTLTDFSGAQFNRDAITRFKEAAAYDRAHVIRAAIIGVDTLPEVYLKAVQSFSAREFRTFATREEALAYLTSEEAGQQTA